MVTAAEIMIITRITEIIMIIMIELNISGRQLTRSLPPPEVN